MHYDILTINKPCKQCASISSQVEIPSVIVFYISSKLEREQLRQTVMNGTPQLLH